MQVAVEHHKDVRRSHQQERYRRAVTKGLRQRREEVLEAGGTSHTVVHDGKQVCLEVVESASCNHHGMEQCTLTSVSARTIPLTCVIPPASSTSASAASIAIRRFATNFNSGASSFHVCGKSLRKSVSMNEADLWSPRLRLTEVRRQ